MKVVQINSVCGYGSTGRIAVEISKALTNKHIENYILYGIKQSDYNLGIKISSDLYVRTNIIKTRLFGKHGFYSKIATRRLINHLKIIKPDIIHLHNLHGHYLNVEMLFDYINSIKDIKVFWTMHDCWSITGHCTHFEFVGCNKWKTGCENCEQLREYPISMFFDRSKEAYSDKKYLFKNINDLTIITPSKWLKKIIGESFLNSKQIITINNGIDISVFRPNHSNIKSKMGIQDKKIILGVSMGFGVRKGYEYYLKLSEKLPKDYIIILIGVSKQQIQSLPSNIIGIERTNNLEQMTKLYTAADVFVNMTLEDTFPTVNIESLACGTPVVTWKTGGSPEIVDEKTGIVVNRLDVDAIYSAICNIVDSDMDYVSACRNRAKELYDKKLMIEKYIKLYKGELYEKNNSL